MGGGIRDIYGAKLARFSPIYDSARGLLWNETESKISDILKDSNRKKQFVEKYCNKSRPKIGIENNDGVNHFELINSYSVFYKKDDFIQNLIQENRVEIVIKKLNIKFKTLLSKGRRSIITDILKYRFETLKKIVT